MLVTPGSERVNRSNRKMCAIHNKYKYFHIIAQRAERQTTKSSIFAVSRWRKRGSKSLLSNQIIQL